MEFERETPARQGQVVHRCIYVVDSFVSVQTKTVQAPEALQSTATYSTTIDSNNNWLITDVGGYRISDGAEVRHRIRRGAAVLVGAVSLCAAGFMTGPSAGADPNDEIPIPGPPSDSSLIKPFPVIVPTPSNWAPKFPFPYDQTKDKVTPLPTLRP